LQMRATPAPRQDKGTRDASTALRPATPRLSCSPSLGRQQLHHTPTNREPRLPRRPLPSRSHPGGNSGANLKSISGGNRWFRKSTPTEMPQESGRICGICPWVVSRVDKFPKRTRTKSRMCLPSLGHSFRSKTNLRLLKMPKPHPRFALEGRGERRSQGGDVPTLVSSTRQWAARSSWRSRAPLPRSGTRQQLGWRSAVAPAPPPR